MKISRFIVISLFVLVVLGCSKEIQKTPANKNAIQLIFSEQEENVEPYQTRVIITQDMMRVDGGDGSIDFVLFDRKQKKIYSVNSERRSIVIVELQQITIEPPFKLELSEKNWGASEDAPKINGILPVHYEFSAKGEVCYEVVAAKGLLEEAVKARREFTTVVASDSAVTFNTIPADLHNACDMAKNTFAPNRHLRYGFPIHEWGKNGYLRSLVDFDENYVPQPGIFNLPKDYQQQTVQQLRGEFATPEDR